MASITRVNSARTIIQKRRICAIYDTGTRLAHLEYRVRCRSKLTWQQKFFVDDRLMKGVLRFAMRPRESSTNGR